MLDQIRVARGFETALATAIGEGLEAALDPGAPAYWRAATTEAAPGFPAGIEPLAQNHRPIRARPGAQPYRSRQGRHWRRGRRGEFGPGQILVTRDGALWRWDGLTRQPGVPSAAAIRLEQRNRLEQVERDLALANRAAESAAAALATAERTLATTT